MPEHSRILIVEDEFILAQDIKNRLTALNYDVIGLCSNGDDALKKAYDEHPDLVLMDIKLEGNKDGIETAAQIQKEMDIPVVFLSAYADKETVKRARISEPMGYLIKPCEEKELETTIEMALYKHHVTHRMRENEKWLATTLGHVADGVIRTDADKRILLLNPSAANMTGWSEKDAKSKKLDDILKIIDEETGEKIEDPVYKRLGVVDETRFLMKSITGKTTPVDFSSTSVKDENGNVTGLVIVLHDITERRRSEQAIERRLKLEKALDEVASYLLRKTDPDPYHILTQLGEAMKADHGVIYDFLDDHKIIEWHSGQCEPLFKSDVKRITSDWLNDKLKKGESIIIVDKHDQDLSDPEREMLNNYQASSIQAVPLKNGDGVLSGMIGFSSEKPDIKWTNHDLQILRVVSEMIASFRARKKAEEELKSSETRFRSLIQNSSDLISVIDRKGKFLYQSPSVHRILGYHPEELIGKGSLDLIHTKEKETVKEKISNNLLNDSGQLNLEFRIKHKNGSWRDLEAVGKQMVYGQSDAIVINSRDVTLRKKSDRELRKAKEKAEEMNRLKTTFLANMSHEIRTPLTGILGYASILHSDLEEEGDREMARRVHESGKRLLGTIDAILDLAKIEADKLDVKLRSVDITKELQHSIELLMPIAVQRNLKLELKTIGSLFARLDPQFFSQVMNNLIGNALKYTHEGEVKVKTERKIVGNNNGEPREMALIYVEDTGVGISDEFIDKIFDEFEQESVGLSRKFEGAGLGLTITKKLVEVMEGQIQVKSEKGKGSTFTVMFPVAKGKELDDYYEESDYDQVSQEIKVQANEEKPKVLLVEDNEDSQIVTKNYLNGSFYLDSVTNGEDALRLLDESQYELILMDINLGDGMDGVEALKKIRESSRHKFTPVVAITAYAMKDDEKYYLDQGFSEYLSKPFSKDDIYYTIGNILNSR